jgi:hypothetical protein
MYFLSYLNYSYKTELLYSKAAQLHAMQALEGKGGIAPTRSCPRN